jgi:hypothetical protein
VSREQSTFVPSSETRPTCAYVADARKGNHRPFRTPSTAHLVWSGAKAAGPMTTSPSTSMPVDGGLAWFHWSLVTCTPGSWDNLNLALVAPSNDRPWRPRLLHHPQRLALAKKRDPKVCELRAASGHVSSSDPA